MKNIIQLLLIFLLISIKSQKLQNDTIKEKVTDIETVIINDKDYEKIDYSFALRKEINSGLKSVNPNSSYEMGLRFNNNLGKKGVVSKVTLFLHKTDSENKLTDLEIIFYKIDTLTNKPGDRINKQKILYTPKNRSRGEIKINVENYHIPFLKEGILVAVKWLPTKEHDKKVGPAIRLTNYTERLTYTRFDNDVTKWSNAINFSRKNGLYTNVMIGLEVYIKRKKNNE